MKLAALTALLLLVYFSALADPRGDYMVHCMGCHLMDGKGHAPDVPPFDQSTAAIASTQAGRAYLAQVPGASQAPITDKALADVLTWILKTYSAEHLPQDFEAFSAREVATYRRTVLLNPLEARNALVSMRDKKSNLPQ